MIEGMPRAKFYIENRNGIDTRVYSLIERTFKRMHVLERYNSSSSGKAYEKIKSLARHKIYDEEEVKGWLKDEIAGKDVNDYVAIFLEVLMSSKESMQWIMDKLSVLHSSME